MQNRIQNVTAKKWIKIHKGWESGIEHFERIDSSAQTLEKSVKGKKRSSLPRITQVLDKGLDI